MKILLESVGSDGKEDFCVLVARDTTGEKSRLKVSAIAASQSAALRDRFSAAADELGSTGFSVRLLDEDSILVVYSCNADAAALAAIKIAAKEKFPDLNIVVFA